MDQSLITVLHTILFLEWIMVEAHFCPPNCTSVLQPLESWNYSSFHGSLWKVFAKENSADLQQSDGMKTVLKDRWFFFFSVQYFIFRLFQGKRKKSLSKQCIFQYNACFWSTHTECVIMSFNPYLISTWACAALLIHTSFSHSRCQFWKFS